MKTSQWILIVLAVITLSVSLLGCAGGNPVTCVKLYDQERFTGDEISRVYVHKNKQSLMDKLFSCYPSSILITKVDGNDLLDMEADGDGYIIPEAVLLPMGKHTFHIRYWPRHGNSGLIGHVIHTNTSSKLSPSIVFDVESGHEYMIGFKEKYNPVLGVMSWIDDVDYWVEDTQSGERINYYIVEQEN